MPSAQKTIRYDAVLAAAVEDVRPYLTETTTLQGETKSEAAILRHLILEGVEAVRRRRAGAAST